MTLEHLILLRHGETDWNRNQRLQGHRDIPLNAVGHHQAIDAAPSIVALRPSVIVSSDLQRARETASAVSVLTGIEATVDERLRETSMGLWEGLTRDEVVASWPGRVGPVAHDVRACRAAGGRVPLAGGATGPTRWSSELDAGTATRALIVSHGGLIVGLTGRLLALPEDSWGTLIGVEQLSLGGAAPVRRCLAAAFLQRRSRWSCAAARRGRGRRHVAKPKFSGCGDAARPWVEGRAASDDPERCPLIVAPRCAGRVGWLSAPAVARGQARTPVRSGRGRRTVDRGRMTRPPWQ